MNPGRLRLFALLPVLLAAGCAAPRPPTPAVQADASGSGLRGTWRAPDFQTLRARIGPPPAPGSAAQRRDIAEVLALQADATPARIAEAKRTLDLSVFTFARAIGPDFTPARYPLTAAFFRRLNDIVRATNDPLKDYFRRPHPFEADPRIRRFVDAPARYSYPSYHAARCVVFWHTLARLDRPTAAAFHAVAQRVQRDRVFAGEHFPSDIAAGRLEGHLIYAALVRDPVFRADLAALKRAEWTPAPRTRQPAAAVAAMEASR